MPNPQDLDADKYGNIGVKDGKPIKKLNKKERMVRREVYARYDDMSNDGSRTEAEADWEKADKMFKQYIPTPDPDDWRAHLTLPDGFAAIQAHLQETIDRKSRPLLKRIEDSDRPIAELANAVMTYNMNRTDFDYQYFLAKYAAAIRGTAFLWNYYRVDKRKIHDIDGLDEEGELKYKEKEVTDYDDDYTEWVENEFIYVDEKAKDVNEAIDCIRREIINIDEFKRRYGLKTDFINVEHVRPGGETTTRSYFKLPKDITEQDVEVLHYFNRATDTYNVVANNIPVRIGYIPYKHKELPVAAVYHYRVPGQFWGMGIPKVIEHLTEERKSIRNLNIDRQKLNINKMFLHNSTFDLDEDDLISRPHGLISVDTQGLSLDQVIRPVEYGDVPPSYFRTEEILLEDIRRAHGIDDRIQGVNVGGTATEAAILKESALKRVNMIAHLAEMDTLIRIGRLKWSNIQFFYPVPRIERITEGNEERTKKVYRNVRVEGKEFTVVKGPGGNELKATDINGSSAFKLDKTMARYLEGDFDITVDANAFTNVSKPIQQAKVTEMFTLLASQPSLINILDPEKSVRRYIEVNDENPRNWIKGDGKSDSEMMTLADSENTVMTQGIPLAATKDATESHTLVHVMFAKTEDFNSLPEAVQQIISDHILAEHDANPSTGSSADLLGQASGEAEGALPPTGPLVPGQTPSIQPEAGPGNQLQPTDMTPTGMGPEE